MSTSSWLTVVAPDSGAVLSRDSASSLARLAGRGRVTRRWAREAVDASLRPWQRGLLEALGVGQGHSASICMSAEAAGDWLHAQPVHLAAGLKNLSFLALTDEAAVGDAERNALFATLAPVLSSGDFVLCAAGEDWFIRSSRPLQVATATPDAAAANELSTVMPRGPDAAVLHRLMTELQMLLHEHPVNEARERRGLPAINALWPWGNGPLVATVGELPMAFGGHAFLQGLYRQARQSVAPLPQDATALLQSLGSTSRAVMQVTDLGRFDEQWLAPLSHALSAGKLAHLDLVLDEWHVDVRRGDLRRFWRRPLSPAQWGQST